MTHIVVSYQSEHSGSNHYLKPGVRVWRDVKSEVMGGRESATITGEVRTEVQKEHTIVVPYRVLEYIVGP